MLRRLTGWTQQSGKTPQIKMKPRRGGDRIAPLKVEALLPWRSVAAADAFAATDELASTIVLPR
jgi:hypothetical protein